MGCTKVRKMFALELSRLLCDLVHKFSTLRTGRQLLETLWLLQAKLKFLGRPKVNQIRQPTDGLTEL